MLVVEQYLNIRLLLKQCPFCLEYLSEKKNKKGENAQKVKKNPSSVTYHRPAKTKPAYKQELICERKFH